MAGVTWACRSSETPTGVPAGSCGANPGDDLAFRVRLVLDGHRTVQREQNAIDRTCSGQAVGHLFDQGIERCPAHRPARSGMTGEQRDGLGGRGLQHAEEARHLDAGRAEPVQHLRAAA